MTNDEAREVSRIARRRIKENGLRIEGLPKFPHVLHTFLTLLTCGVWGVVYMVHYHFSARRKFNENYQKSMLREARANLASRKVYAHV